MKTVGLIVEYNPFHMGHQLHIETSKKLAQADHCIVVMSGNYVQRGEPAIIDKWARTEIALKSGVDIVIELPTLFATASAEYFSTAAVKLLEATGIVDAIVFGSECGNLKSLDNIASLLWKETDAFKLKLNHYLKNGLSFPVARNKAIESFLDDESAEIMKSPNNILGIEYLKALKRQGSIITPYTFKRIGADYHDHAIHKKIASATSIRKHLKNNQPYEVLESKLPTEAYKILTRKIEQHYGPVFYDDFFPLLKYSLLKSKPENLKGILDVTEGFENRIISEIQESYTLESYIDKLQTKRYTRTKINRSLLHILLGIDKKTFNRYIINDYHPYIRVLGFNGGKKYLMKKLKDNANLPIVNNFNQWINKGTSLQKNLLSQEVLGTDIYNTVNHQKYHKISKNDFNHPMIILGD